MFIGIDHGTTAMRFAGEGQEFKVSREEARDFSFHELERICPLAEIEGVAICYSMGDALSALTDIRKVTGRGVITRVGAGEHIGGGTKVYDEIFQSGLPAVVVPGLHRGLPTDPRFKVYSHQASPEKIGIAYEVHQRLGNDFIVSDVSSNTVTLLVSNGTIQGAFDACIFAPGTRHGPLDVNAIRRIDRGEETANEAFLHAGVRENLPPEQWTRTLAMFVAMECAALSLLNPTAAIAIAGSQGPGVADEVERLLRRKVYVFDEWCASRGLVKIARDVFSGKDCILGIGCDL